MLIEFSVENFLSIKEKVTLSMVATADQQLPNNVFACELLPNEEKKLSKIASIYGPNASGKSNLLKALMFLFFIVLNSHKNQVGDKLPITPFKLDGAFATSPTSFDISFIHEDVRYAYGVKIDSEKIYEEYLYCWLNDKQVKVFERTDTSKFDFPLKAESDIEKAKQEVYREATLDNILFLSQATKLKHETITQAFDWFRKNRRFIIDHEDVDNFTSSKVEEDPEVKKRVLRYLKAADFSIFDIAVKHQEHSYADIPDALKQEMLEIVAIRKNIEPVNIEQVKIHSVEEKFFHQGIDLQGVEVLVPFDIKEESDGTQSFYSLIGAIDYILNNGFLLVVDELDKHLHPLLVRFIINLFTDENTNPKNAQLIFTTHNLDLFDPNILRLDQIWLTERERYGGDTKLFSLSEFKIEDSTHILERYLQGRYGAVPMID